LPTLEEISKEITLLHHPPFRSAFALFKDEPYNVSVQRRIFGYLYDFQTVERGNAALRAEHGIGGLAHFERRVKFDKFVCAAVLLRDATYPVFGLRCKQVVADIKDKGVGGVCALFRMAAAFPARGGVASKDDVAVVGDGFKQVARCDGEQCCG